MNNPNESGAEPEMPKSKVSSAEPNPQDETSIQEVGTEAGTPVSSSDENPAAGEGVANAKANKSSLAAALKAVTAPVWLLFLAALVLVGGVGYLVGSNSFGSGTTVNLAGATPGKGDLVAKPNEDGAFDAKIYGPKTGTTVTSQEDLLNIHRREAGDPFALGAVDAPIVMSVFSDFECPYCAKFAVESEPGLVKDYVDAGLLRIEWNDLAINGDRAVRSAEAARAAAAQGKFWEFNKILFEAASKKTGHPEFTDEDLIRFAEQAGVADMNKFKDELKSDKWKEPVLQATEYGQGLGIQGTPQFLIGSTSVSGALPEQEFRDRIELELMKVVRATSAK